MRLASLRHLLDAARSAAVADSCQQCGAALGADHGHVADLDARSLLCVCERCRTTRVAGHADDSGRRVVPRRYLQLPAFVIGDEDWTAFEIPVGIAFFFQNSALGRCVAAYPSPAGATESLLPAAAWERVLRSSAWTRALVPDVEALLVRRTRDANDCFLVPIDACYELVGRMRTHWSGFGGGPEAERAIDAFFARLRARSERVAP